MLKELLNYFPWVIIGLVLVASLIGVARYRQLPLSLRYLALLACFDIVMELTGRVLHDILGVKSILFLIPFIAIGELAPLALAYRQVLQSAAFTKTLPWLLGLFSGYALVISFSQLGIVSHAVSVEVIMDLLTIGLAGLYFQKLLNELHIERLRYAPFFWVSIGLMTHGLGDLLISLFSNYLLTHCSEQLQLLIMWGVRNVFNALLYTSYCVALWLRPQQDHAALAAPSTQRHAW